ncbi:MAG: hypothetical protein IJW08_03100 [Lentisphaeria bacterium]|nr:hypothetical protein [Lentisphaeria bacterium]
MKKFLPALLLTMILQATLYSADFENKGAVSGWSFSPLQVDVGLVHNKKLFDESTDTFLSLGVFILRQKSAVLSYAFVANTLQNNYGVQLPPLFLGTATDNNYGISLGWQNFCKKCYGIQIGLLNNSWSGEPVEENRKRTQILGINIADTVYAGLVNISNMIQIGLVNISPGALFQIGLINYNPRSYIPWMPLINFNMGREK